MTLLTDTQASPVDMQSRRSILFNPGDTVRVHQRIKEKDKVRIQVFEGVVIARKHGTEPGATLTVRRLGSDGIAVEKIFPLYSPMIDRIEVIRRTKMRRARLYFLREKTPKQIREKLRRTKVMSVNAINEQQRERADDGVGMPEDVVHQEMSNNKNTSDERVSENETQEGSVDGDTILTETSAGDQRKREEG